MVFHVGSAVLTASPTTSKAMIFPVLSKSRLLSFDELRSSIRVPVAYLRKSIRIS